MAEFFDSIFLTMFYPVRSAIYYFVLSFFDIIMFLRCKDNY